MKVFFKIIYTHNYSQIIYNLLTITIWGTDFFFSTFRFACDSLRIPIPIAIIIGINDIKAKTKKQVPGNLSIVTLNKIVS